MAALPSRLPAYLTPDARTPGAVPAGHASGGEGAGVITGPAAHDGAAAVPLTTMAKGATGRVAGVRVAPAASGATLDPAVERMALRLIEIGFVEGEPLRVVAFGQPGDDPIGVRIGGRGGLSTFALRRVEAACVWVVPDAAALG
jgi:ferrous iron transport protein A